MKAIVQDRYGPADALRLEEVERPTPGDGEVLVHVRAASVNVADWLTMNGRPYIVRPTYGGWRRPKTRVRGKDVAGTVEAVGTSVTRVHAGDEVFGWCEAGTFAEYVCGPESHFAPKPPRLTFEQAAAVPLTAATALRNVRDVGRLRSGQRILINGAAGGVGTFAVQVAKSMGGAVTGVCSTRNVAMVRSIGADQVIDYTQEDFTRNGQRYDLILDNVMNHSLSEYRRVLTPEGTLILNNGTSGGAWLGPLGRMVTTLVRSKVVHQRVCLAALPRPEDLLVLNRMVEAGDIAPVLDRTFKLAEAREAMRYVGAGHARGKVVICL